MSTVHVVVPVRFDAGGSVVQTTTSELSVETVVIRCLHPPPAGTPIDLLLYLPGLSEPLGIGARIDEVLAHGAEGAFRARFEHVTARAAAEISGLVERRLRTPSAQPVGAVSLRPAPAGSEDRTFPRVPARFAVRFGTVQDFVLEYAANLSAGGLFIETRVPPELHAVVRVAMELPGSPGPVLALGRVVHRVTVEEAHQRGVTPGVGVQFIDSDDEFRRRLDAAIDAILSREPPAG